MQEDRFRGWILFLSILLLVILFVLGFVVVFVRSHAQEQVQQTVSIQNSPPIVETVVESMEPHGPPADLFLLTTGRDSALYVWGTASDPNGCSDLQTVDVKVYRSDLGQGCVEKPGLCMSVSRIPIEGCAKGFNIAGYAASIPMPYYTDPTDDGSPSEAKSWVAQVTVTDRQGAQGRKESAPFNVASLSALDTDDRLDFGTLLLGATTNATPLRLINLGNRAFDVQVVSYGSLVCGGAGSIGIPSESVHASLAADSTYNQSIALSSPNEPTQQFALVSDYQFAAYRLYTPVVFPAGVSTQLTGTGTSSLYFFLQVPDSGVSGVCTGSLGITALPK